MNADVHLHQELPTKSAFQNGGDHRPLCHDSASRALRARDQIYAGQALAHLQRDETVGFHLRVRQALLQPWQQLLWRFQLRCARVLLPQHAAWRAQHAHALRALWLRSPRGGGSALLRGPSRLQHGAVGPQPHGLWQPEARADDVPSLRQLPRLVCSHLALIQAFRHQALAPRGVCAWFPRRHSWFAHG